MEGRVETKVEHSPDLNIGRGVFEMNPLFRRVRVFRIACILFPEPPRQFHRLVGIWGIAIPSCMAPKTGNSSTVQTSDG